MSTKKLQVLDYTIKQAENSDTVDGKHASDFASATDMTTVQGNISDLQAKVGDTAVSSQISSAIVNKSDIGHTHNVATETTDGFMSANDKVKFDNYTAATAYSSSGTVITMDDASDGPLQGLRIYGRTTQDGTPTPDAPVELESVGDGGSVVTTICGHNICNPADYHFFDKGLATITAIDGGFKVTSQNTQSSDAYYWAKIGLIDAKAFEGQTLTVSCKINRSNAGTKPGIGIPLCGADGTTVLYLAEIVNESSAFKATFTVPDCEDGSWIGAILYVARGGAVNANDYVEFYDFQIEVGDTATAYVPYKGAQTIATPNGLPGIPVTSGGNYTDENGQQWICDEVDFARGVYVQRIMKLSLNISDMNNSEDYPGWKKVSGVINSFGSTTTNIPGGRKGLCNIGFPTVGAVGINNISNNGVLFLSKMAFGLSQEEWKAQYPDLVFEIAFPMNTTIENALSDDDLSAFAALHTNKPNTTIYNDAGAYMDVEYCTPNTAVPMLYSEVDAGKILAINEYGYVIKKADDNTTYSLSKSGSTITLTGSDGSTSTVTDSDTTYSAATTSTAGLMSASDKTKLDGIATGANKTTVDSALSSTSTNPVQNKVITTEISNLNTLVGDTAVSDQIASALSNAISKKTVQLTVSGWSSNQQTVSVNGVSASNLVIVSPDPETSNYSAYIQCEVRCTAQAAGALTFSCNKVPSVAISVNVAVLS